MGYPSSQRPCVLIFLIFNHLLSAALSHQTHSCLAFLKQNKGRQHLSFPLCLLLSFLEKVPSLASPPTLQPSVVCCLPDGNFSHIGHPWPTADGQFSAPSLLKNHLFKFLHWVFVAAWAFSSCSKWGPVFVGEFLTVVASLVSEYGL